MPTIADIRQQYPDYGDMTDAQLAQAVHAKFYSDMPFSDFAQKVGLQQQSPQHDPTEGMSTAQKYFAGMGKQFADWGRGLAQIGTQLDPTVSTPQAQQAVQGQVDEARRQDAPLMNTTAGKLGAMTASAAPFVLAPAGYAGAAAAGAAEGALTPTAQGESRAANTALGAGAGLAGQAAGAVVGRIIKPIGNYLTADRQAATDALLRAGVPLDAAQLTGSRLMVTAKNAAADSPLQGPSQLPSHQADAFTRAVLRTVGVDSDSASQSVMNGLRQELKSNYNAIASRNQIAVDLQSGTDPLVTKLGDIRADAETALRPEDASVIFKQIGGITNAANKGMGTIDGRAYQAIQSALDRVPGDGGKAPFVSDLRQALTDALRRSASPKDVELLAQTDQRYAGMKQIQQAIDGNKVRPDLLYNAMDTQARAGQSVYGDGPNQALFHLAEAGRMVLGRLAQTANSGTTQRAAGMALFGTAAGLADNRLHGGNGVETSLAALAGAAFGPAAARAVIENPRVATAIAGWARSKGIQTVADVSRWIAARGASGAAAQTGLSPPPAQ